MIVFDLICGNGHHQFEGWFSSSAEYDRQQAQRLIACPTCGSTAVGKAVMAPNVGAKGNQRPSTSERSKPSLGSSNQGVEFPVTGGASVPAEYREMLGKVAELQAKMLEKSEWVGEDFAEEARAIHYGEKDEKPIHGTASLEDAEELEEEGITVTPLLVPVAPPEKQN